MKLLNRNSLRYPARFCGWPTLQVLAFRSAGRDGPCITHYPPGPSMAPSILRPSPPAPPCGSGARSGWSPQPCRKLTRYRWEPTSGSNAPMSQVSFIRLLVSASTFLTTTDLPIERTGRFWATGFHQYREFPLVKTASTQAEAEVDLTLTLPPDLPAGYYRPFLSVQLFRDAR